MDYIKYKAIELITLSVVISLLSVFISNTRFSKLLKNVGGLLLLVCLTASLSPLTEIMREIDFGIFDTDITEPDIAERNDVLLNSVAGELCKEISVLICERFSLSEEIFDVFVTLDPQETDKIRLTAVTVKFHTAIDEELSHSIADYVSDVTAATCTVFLPEN